MSKVTTAVSKKKVKKKKTESKSSPDLLENVQALDLELDYDLDLDDLANDQHFKSHTLPKASSLHKGVDRDEQEEPMFPHEVHMALKNQIQNLEEENEELKAKLKHAEERLASISPLRNVGRASDLAANRIVELSKKIKDLQGQIKVQDYKLGKKGYRNDHLAGGDVSGNGTGNPDCGGTCCTGTKTELIEMTEKFSVANTKLCELRNQNQHLRHEYKLALKALSSEIGEKVNVQNIISSGQGWRGRAQQILGLQQKVAELTEKLSHAQANSNSQGCGDRTKTEQVESMRFEIETLKTESDTVKSEMAETKRRLEESRARVSSLQTELSALRTANAAIAQRMSSDKKLIESLNSQLGNLQEKAKGKETVINNKYEHQITLLKRDLSQERLKNEQLQESLKEKESKIAVLQVKSSSINPRYNQSVVEEAANSEARCLSARSISHESTSNTGCNSEAERARLMELVGVNARRLQEERKNSSVLDEQLRAERHRCARLETKLARLEMERVGWAKGLYKKPPTVEPVSRSDVEWDTLKDKMELLEEKCLALESRLKTLQQEKEEDNRRFIQIIDEHRASYVDLHRKSTAS